jgi:hypothetical protein
MVEALPQQTLKESDICRFYLTLGVCLEPMNCDLIHVLPPKIEEVTMNASDMLPPSNFNLGATEFKPGKKMA